VQLEPLAESHLGDLWDASVGAANSWAHLTYGPFSTPAEMAAHVEELRSRVDQPFWAVRPKSSGRAEGWLSLCDVDPAAAAMEIGSIWFAPPLQKTRASTEAVFLLMSYAMDVLGYHRLVWRCSAENRASLAAAARYGFRPEGVWRGARFKNGRFVNVAWHSIIGEEWLERRRAIAEWLADDNFDPSGRALRSLMRPPRDTA
jgi:RimJ/RimL family protein N-acetyltransferase